MIDEEICRKVTELGKAGKKTLIYCISTDVVADEAAQETRQCFGISVSIAEDGEQARICGITSKRREAENLLDLLATGLVTPVALRDVVDDWLCG